MLLEKLKTDIETKDKEGENNEEPLKKNNFKENISYKNQNRTHLAEAFHEISNQKIKKQQAKLHIFFVKNKK